MDRQFQALKDIFVNSSDIIFAVVRHNEDTFNLIYEKEMTNFELLEKYYMQKLEELLANNNYNLLQANLASAEELNLTDIPNITSKAYSGFLLVYSSNIKRLYAINNAKAPNRSPELRGNDIAIAGSRDGFIENIDTNIALLRKRIPSERLKYFTYEIGKITKTRVALAYIEGIADETIIEQVKLNLENCQVDCVYNIGHLQALLTNSKQIVPKMTYTMRSDYCSESLLTGRFVVFMNSVPLANIGPVSLSFFTNFADSSNESFWVGFLHRLLLYFSLFIGLFLSGLAAAIFAHDNEFMPFLMLANYINARKGISMTIATELILGDSIFQLFRIAGSRPLSGINQVLLLMGSVIIGQITVSAGIISQEVMLISAISMISTYIISNNFSLNTSINFLRVGILLSSLIFGFIGFVISSMLVIIYLVGIESFGIPLLSPVAPFSLKNLKYIFMSKSYVSKEANPKKYFSKFKNGVRK